MDGTKWNNGVGVRQSGRGGEGGGGATTVVQGGYVYIRMCSSG